MYLKQKEWFLGPSLVMGNGPSAKLLDFKSPWLRSITTVGMNSAYRFWDEVGFRPTYYICMDDVVLNNIADDVMRLVREGSIKQFLLKDSIKEVCPEAATYRNIIWYSEIIQLDSIFRDCQITTGGWAIRWMLSKGYKYIATIGIDGINTEVLSESEKDEASGKLGLKVKETPKFNPNYFFSGYQQKGDKYQVPNNPGYMKSKGRLFHEDALLSIHRYMKEANLESKVVDMSPLSNHGIFPKIDLLSFKDKTSIGVVIDLKTIGLSEAIRITTEIGSRALSQRVYWVVPKSRIEECRNIYIPSISLHILSDGDTLRQLYCSLQKEAGGGNLVVLSKSFEEVNNFIRTAVTMAVLNPDISLIPVSRNIYGNTNVLGAAFDLGKLVGNFDELLITDLFGESCPALLKIARTNICSMECSLSTLDNGYIPSEDIANKNQITWPYLFQFSENFPQIRVSEDTLAFFSQRVVWLGDIKNKEIKGSFQRMLAFCVPRETLLPDCFESLTIKIDGINFSLDDSTVLKIESFMRSGGMIEWEVTGFGTEFTFIEFIESLKSKSYLGKLSAGYPVQSFVNIDGATPEQRIAHADLMLVVKYLLGEGKANNREEISLKSKMLKIEPGVKCPGGVQNFSEPIVVRQKGDIAYGVIYCDFGNSQISEIKFDLKFVVRRDDILHFRLCRNGSTRFESQDAVINANRGENHVSLSIAFSEVHIGCRLEMSGANSGENCLLIESIEVTGKEKFSEVKSDKYSKPSSGLPVVPCIEEQNRSFLKYSKSVVAILDPDGIDLRGHYLAYDRKLADCFQDQGISTKILCRKDIDTDNSTYDPISYIKCFERHSWTIATNMDLFRKELECGLENLVESEGANVKTILYFYTASIHHLSVLCDILESGQNICVHLNLFWEMIRDVEAPEYASLVGQVMKRIEQFEGRIVVSAPTSGVQRIIKNISGVELPIAPHPSTAVSDKELLVLGEHLQEAAASTLMSNKKNGDISIVFPGASTIHKGYELGLSAASKLAQMGYICWVREEPGYEGHYKNLKLIPRQLSDEDFKKFLREADVIVLPYQSEGFANRTSGLVVDALYLGVPVVVIKGTWLSEIVTDFQSGVSVDSDQDEIVQGVKRILDTSSYSKKILLEQALNYFAQNSWVALTDFIINKFTFDFVDYKYANYLFREGMYKESRKIYETLFFINEHSMYKRNIELCDMRLNGVNG